MFGRKESFLCGCLLTFLLRPESLTQWSFARFTCTDASRLLSPLSSSSAVSVGKKPRAFPRQIDAGGFVCKSRGTRSHKTGRAKRNPKPANYFETKANERNETKPKTKKRKKEKKKREQNRKEKRKEKIISLLCLYTQHPKLLSSSSKGHIVWDDWRSDI